MMCFKDMTFCANSDECGNTDCPRKFTDKDRQDAIAWWGSDEVPIAWSDFKDDCGKFVEVESR